MCEYYGLPLALIFEELVDMDKPEDKAQEQRPAEAEQEQQSKGTANNQPPPLCLQQIDSRRPLPCIALYAAFMRLVVLGYSRQLKRPLAASRGLVWPCVCVPLHHRYYPPPALPTAAYSRLRCWAAPLTPPPPGVIIWYIPAPSARLRPRKKRASEGVIFTRSIQWYYLACACAFAFSIAAASLSAKVGSSFFFAFLITEGQYFSQ